MQPIYSPGKVEILPGVEAGLVYLYDTPVMASALRLHLVDQPWTAWFVRRGTVRVWTTPRGQEPPLKATKGMWLLLPPGKRSHEMAMGTHLWSLRFALTNAEGWPAIHGPRPLCFRGREAAKLLAPAEELSARIERWLEPSSDRICFRKFRQLGKREDPRLVALAARRAWLTWMETFLHLVLSKGWVWTDLEQDRRPIVGRLKRALAGSSLPPLRPAALAQRLGISPTHLRRLFHKELACSPTEWIDQQRLISARQRIGSGTEPLKTIAHDLGFSSAPHFWTWFRRQTGLTPLQWQKTHRQIGV
jgi:AraC-like DNA-binding protein